MSVLRISEALKLPMDAVTQRISILGRTRSGKSHTAGVIVEEILKARQQVVILDPKGDWWGLRSSADGKSAGLPITIMGGKHGDVPLEPTAGALIADVVVNERVSFVLDLSLFESKAEEIRFVTAFLDRLYRKNEEPVLLVVDEADIFSPQKPEKNETLMLNRMETICRRGAGKGIGVVLISQRSASIHKGCLSQTELMIAHQTTAPQDKKAIELWVVDHSDEDRREAFMNRIPKLPRGTAIIWSPSWLEIYKEVGIRQKETYDSGDAPRVGKRRRAPKVLAQVDLERLKKHMAETIEKAKQEDPKLLRAEVHKLKSELVKAQSMAKLPAPVVLQGVKPETIRVEVPFIPAAQLVRLEHAMAAADRAAGKAQEALGGLRGFSDLIRDNVRKIELAAKRPEPPRGPLAIKHAMLREHPPAAPFHRKATPAPAQEGNGEGMALSSLAKRILKALLTFESFGFMSVQRSWIAGWLSLSYTSGGFRNMLGGLRSGGLISYPSNDTLSMTGEGRGVAPIPDVEPGTAILDHCLRAVAGQQAKILKVVHGAYPDCVSRIQVAEALNVSPTSGGFRNSLGGLRTAGMITYPDKEVLRCSDWVSTRGSFLARA